MKETKEILKKYGHDIILSVIVSIITGLILGAGNWLIKTVPAVGHSFFEAIRNIVYSLAATMSDNMLNFLIVAFILAGIILVVFVVLEYGVSLLKRVYVFGKKENEQLNNLQKDFDELLQNEELEENLEDKIKNSKEKLIKDGKKLAGYLIGFVLVVLIFVSSFFVFVCAPVSIRDKFEVDVTMISPYAEEKEIVQLKSDWVCMRSKEDYEEIYKIIDEVKENNNLPK